MGHSVITKGPTLREMAERGKDVKDVLLQYTPTWAQRATRDLYSVVDSLDEIEKDRVYEFAGFTSFEEYVEKGLGQQMWWVDGARDIIRKDVAAREGKPITVAEADKEIRSKREERLAIEEEMKKDGATQQQIADELGVNQSTVSRDLCKKSVITQKTHKNTQPRKVTGYRITEYTDPKTAAQKIRATFGDDFAEQLCDELQSNF